MGDTLRQPHLAGLASDIANGAPKIATSVGRNQRIAECASGGASVRNSCNLLWARVRQPGGTRCGAYALHRMLRNRCGFQAYGNPRIIVHQFDVFARFLCPCSHRFALETIIQRHHASALRPHPTGVLIRTFQLWRFYHPRHPPEIAARNERQNVRSRAVRAHVLVTDFWRLLCSVPAWVLRLIGRVVCQNTAPGACPRLRHIIAPARCPAAQQSRSP